MGFNSGFKGLNPSVSDFNLLWIMMKEASITQGYTDQVSVWVNEIRLSIRGTSKGFCFSSKCAERTWDQKNFPVIWCPQLLLWQKGNQNVKLTAHPYLAQRLRTILTLYLLTHMTPIYEEGQNFFLIELTIKFCKSYQQYKIHGSPSTWLWPNVIMNFLKCT